MMRKISLCLSIALMAMTVQMLAQSHWKCGNTAADGEAMKANMIHTRAEMRDFVRPRNAVTYVAVRFWMVAKSNGEGRPSEQLALRALCRLNENYADQDIQFYIKEFKYYNNSTVYDNPQGFSGVNAISNQMFGNYNALNVFINDDAGGGAAAYFQLPAGPNGNDWIVAGDNYVDDLNTLTHEVGHFFNLPHPFNGWESTQDGWDASIHGNPVGPNSPDGVANERADGSNCMTAGDAICDTPADYMFPFPGPDNCTYDKDAKDPTGALISPVINNFMNYGSCNSYFFTDQQKEEITNSLFSSNRAYVRPNYTPNTAVVTEKPTILTPTQGETINTYNAVPLSWTAVPGADMYWVQIISPSVGTYRYIVQDNSLTVTNLVANSTYLWRVVGFNEYSTCMLPTSDKIFKTGSDVFSDTFEIPNIEDWNVRPNPARNGGNIEVNVESSVGIEATVSLLSITGQVVATYPRHQFPNGISSLDIPVNGFAPGIYFVTLQTETGFETRRVSIVD